MYKHFGSSRIVKNIIVSPSYYSIWIAKPFYGVGVIGT